MLFRSNGVPVRLGDVAWVQIGPEMRRGIADLNGEGEVVGGVIIMRSGRNALQTIEAVKAKLADLKESLPAGVEIVPTYDRSSLIGRAIDNLRGKLIEEFIIVAFVCAIFCRRLGDARAAAAVPGAPCCYACSPTVTPVSGQRCVPSYCRCAAASADGGADGGGPQPSCCCTQVSPGPWVP